MMLDDTRILKLDKITHSRLESLVPKKTAVIVAISPIETHGPHLPLGQDWFESSALAEAAAAKAMEKWDDWTLVIAPPIPIGCGTIPHFGSINYPAPLVRDVAFYSLRPFAERGFARLGFSSFHGDPRHFCALEDAADKLSRKYNVAAMSFFSVVASRMMERDFFFDALQAAGDNGVTLKQIESDPHAGLIETSLGLYLWPDLVDDEWKNLPPLFLNSAEDPHKELLFGHKSKGSLIEQMQKAQKAVEAAAGAIKHYKARTYAGSPALSSPERGKLLFDRIVEETSSIVDEFFEKGRKMKVHSPVWNFRKALLNPPLNTVLDDWLHLHSG